MAYEFTPEGYTQFTNDILAANGDQATLTGYLSDMQETISTQLTTTADNTAKINALTAETERLREANKKLFFRVGQSISGDVLAAPAKEEHKETTSEYMNKYFERIKK